MSAEPFWEEEKNEDDGLLNELDGQLRWPGKRRRGGSQARGRCLQAPKLNRTRLR